MSVYESLRGVSSFIKGREGGIESCCLDQPNTISTTCGTLTPHWQDEGVRRKHIPSVTFYPSGAVKAVSLEEQTPVETPLGVYPAEFVTFYESGAVCRVFPVNGKISAYWPEEEEAALCPVLQFRLPCGAFRAKVISLHFYGSGALRSVALWPGETVILRTNVGMMAARNGFALYENGALESVEPPHPLAVETPVGVLTAYDSDALGLYGDRSSLSFTPEGLLRTVTTSSDQVEVILPDHTTCRFCPAERADPLDDEHTLVSPLRLTFTANSVTFDNSREHQTFSLTDCAFRAFTQEGKGTGTLRQSPMTCGDCSTCTLCG